MTTTNMESVREITAEQMELIAGAGAVAPLAPNPYESPVTAGAVKAITGNGGAALSGGAASAGAQVSGPGRLAPNPYK
jgi:hypothetical protein